MVLGNFILPHWKSLWIPFFQVSSFILQSTDILKNNDIRSVTVVRMEVPCCGGIENAVRKALQASGKFLPWNVVTISTDGRVLDGV